MILFNFMRLDLGLLCIIFQWLVAMLIHSKFCMNLTELYDLWSLSNCLM